MIVTKAELKQTKKIWAWVCFVYFPPPPFWAARQRRYKILHLRLVCGVRCTWELVLIFFAARQKHATRAIQLILFLTPDAWYWPNRARTRGSYPGLKSKRQRWPISTRTIQIKAHPTPNRASFAGLFSAVQHCNSKTSSEEEEEEEEKKSEDSLDDVILTICLSVSRDFAI